MPRASPSQNAVTAGELSPLAYGRQDIQKYSSALATCLNAFVLVQGPWTRRPGTRYINTTKDSGTKRSVLIPFQFSVEQAYVLEFGNQYIRFFTNQGRLENPPGTPVEVATNYLEADLFNIRFTQSADVLYLLHPSYPPAKLLRNSATSWTIQNISFLDGPYLNTNRTTTTLTPSATTGSINITASSTTGINNNLGWLTTDVGRLVRIKHSSTWGYAIITSRTSSTVVVATVLSSLGGVSATLDWRLGLWSDTTGYPACGTFFEDRLFLAGADEAPQRVDGSKSGDYENFAPTDTAGVIADDNAIAVTLNSNTVNVIRWLMDDEKGLLAGTAGGEWIIRPSAINEALTPFNAVGKQSTGFGSANIQPMRSGKVVLYLQRAARKLRELAFVFEVDGFRAPDMTLLSEHLTRPSIVQMAYQQQPQSILWLVRTDGVLLGFSYERDQDVTAWHKHVLGGPGTSGNAPAVVESVAVIPSPDGTRDEAWLIVKRWVNGAQRRYVELLTKVWEIGDLQADSFFVDSGLSYDGLPTVTLSGLDHLIGEQVTILADGAVHPPRTVSGGGTITLDHAASKVHAGYAYNSDGQTLPIEAGAADGTAQGKTKRIHRVAFWLMDTLGLLFGPGPDFLTRLIVRKWGENYGDPPSLFTGVVRERFEGEYQLTGQVFWRADQPLPATLLSVMPGVSTQDDV